VTDFEEICSGAASERSVLNQRLSREVLGRWDRYVHAFNGQERRQVSGVRRHDD